MSNLGAHEAIDKDLTIAALRARVAELEQRLGNLLARIHRDGGHYITEHGWAKAEADADAKIVQWIARDND